MASIFVVLVGETLPGGAGFATMVTCSSLHGTAPILLGWRMPSVQSEVAKKLHFPTGMRQVIKPESTAFLEYFL
jgi:hypothetical protein